jgi:hypothetical protein
MTRATTLTNIEHKHLILCKKHFISKIIQFQLQITCSKSSIQIGKNNNNKKMKSKTIMDQSSSNTHHSKDNHHTKY